MGPFVGLSGHIVSFFRASVPVQVRTNTQTYRETNITRTYRETYRKACGRLCKLLSYSLTHKKWALWLGIWVSGPVVGIAVPMFHFWCPAAVLVRTYPQTYMSWKHISDVLLHIFKDRGWREETAVGSIFNSCALYPSSTRLGPH
jgi:hypothetical protein